MSQNSEQMNPEVQTLPGTIPNELKTFLPSAIEHGIEQALNSRFPTVLETIREVVDSSVAVRLSQQPEVKSNTINEVDELKAEINASKKDVESLSKKLAQSEEKALLMQQKLRVSEERAKKLNNFILKSGSNASGPNDEQIEKAFEKLRFSILQVVKTYCTNENPTIKDPWFVLMSTEGKDFWVMEIISRAVWNYCFSPSYFRFNATDDKMLYQFYQSLRKTPHVPSDDLRQWRILTRKLGTAWDKDGLYQQENAIALMNTIIRKLMPFLPPSGFLPGFAKPEPNPKLKELLLDICNQGYSLAQIFRTSEVEYDWLHHREEQLDPEYVDVIASAGRKEFSPQGGYKIVFGGVIKGGGLHGKFKDGTVHITTSKVLLGPPGDMKVG